MSDEVGSAHAHTYTALAGALASRYRIERVLGEGGTAGQRSIIPRPIPVSEWPTCRVNRQL